MKDHHNSAETIGHRDGGEIIYVDGSPLRGPRTNREYDGQASHEFCMRVCAFSIYTVGVFIHRRPAKLAARIAPKITTILGRMVTSSTWLLSYQIS